MYCKKLQKKRPIKVLVAFKERIIIFLILAMVKKSPCNFVYTGIHKPIGIYIFSCVCMSVHVYVHKFEYLVFTPLTI